MSRVGRRLTVIGTVQGVGFRPFVWRLAHELGLAGWVRNDAAGVTIEAFGPAPALDALEQRLVADAPAAARVAAVRAQPLPDEPLRADSADFVIKESGGAAERRAAIPPDLATCPDCLRELRDPADRRHRYPFTNCTACGPRFTIALGIPYDRPATTMAGFRMCPACAREYADPGDRRFHAQPNACPACGPRVALLGAGGAAASSADPIADAAAALRAGSIAAVKGLGGWHLACDATSSAAVQTLRARKRREEKPLAVMVRDLDAARTLAMLSPAEEALLAAPERPIVLCRHRADAPLAPALRQAQGERESAPLAPALRQAQGERESAPLAPAHRQAQGERESAPPTPAPRQAQGERESAPLAPEVAPGTALVGLLLPYTPLHHLLLAEVGRPLVMTSGNLSEEPIVYEDADALRRLGGIADVLLVHDRPIASRCDDSVARVIAGRPMVTRRARGYVPRPVRVAPAVTRPVLAAGAQLKNACCLARGEEATLGPHVGDLDGLETFEAFEAAVARLEAFLSFRPEAIACDLHPQYLSTRWARARADALGVPLVEVQHHHAHAAAAMAEHGLPGPALALAWDGTGLGTDGAAWGGELLLVEAGRARFERLATFRPLPLAGGDAAIREPWRLAVAAVRDAFGDVAILGGVPAFGAVPERARAGVLQLLQTGLHCPLAHGAGRAFDAAATLALGRTDARFEGQLAMALEGALDPGASGTYPFEIGPGAPGTPAEVLDLRPLWRALVGDVLARTPAGAISARFHRALAAAGAELVRRAVRRIGRLPLVLTGGCFQNAALTEGLREALAGVVEVYQHETVPPGDGGIALGQAVVADAVLRGE